MPYLVELNSTVTCDQLSWLRQNFKINVDFKIEFVYFKYQRYAGIQFTTHNDHVSDTIIFNKESDAMMFTLRCL